MSNPITLEKWTNNSDGQTVTVMRGLRILDVPDGGVLWVKNEGNDRVLVISPSGYGKFVLFDSFAKGWTLQPEEALPPPSEVPNY